MRYVSHSISHMYYYNAKDDKKFEEGSAMKRKGEKDVRT